MGYTTKFSGELRFTNDITASQLAIIKDMFWIEEKDMVSKGYTWSKGKPHYIQFEFTEDMQGIQWDESEKFYEAVNAVNFIIENGKRFIPGFGLTGELTAQGEDIDDRWYLRINADGWAEKVEIPAKGSAVDCPECGHSFIVGENK